jgi:hypothetical protein
MKKNRCPEEERILYSVRTGCWDNASGAHLEECADCRETAEMAGLLCKLAADEKKSALPDAQTVWWNAQIAYRERIAEKALRPLTVANLAAGIILILLATAALLRGWSMFLSSGWPSRDSQALQLAVISVTALAICSVIVIFLTVFSPIFTEE